MRSDELEPVAGIPACANPRCMAFFIACLLAGCGGDRSTSDEPAAVAASAFTSIRDEWLPAEAAAVHWHWQKDRHGPALTGNESWRAYLGFLETRLAASGVVDIERNAWEFRRWSTSHWPDDSRWSLTVAGEHVSAASFGANSGSTGEAGVTAPLVRYDAEDPPAQLDGRIVVFETDLDPDAVAALENADYEFLSDAESYPEPGEPLPGDVRPVSWRIFPQLMQTRSFVQAVRGTGAAGALFVFDAGREQMAGMYTFPVPAIYDVPTLMLDREAGRRVLDAAAEGERAALRLEADVVDSRAWQLIGFLPGRHYGAPEDEVIQMTTHSDGPSVSQDNGPLGLLGVVEYFARIPRAERPRTLMVFFDCRHFMPGAEEAFHDEDYFVRNPDARERVVAVVGMEHLGQIEYEEAGHELVPSGRTGSSLAWVADNERLVELAIAAVRDSGLPSAYVRNVDRPGIHGRSQGRWYGMASFAREAGLPAFAIMGTLGAYWATSSGVERFDPDLFRRQVATTVRVTADLMRADLGPLQPRSGENGD